MRGIKLLFTNKYYRWAILEKLKLKLISLLGIKHIVAWIHGYKMHKEMQNMNQWERYVAFRELENNTKTYGFVCALIRLKVCIMTEFSNKELFEQAKSDVLCNEIIAGAKYKEFREWVQGIDLAEKDYSRVEELINSFT